MQLYNFYVPALNRTLTQIKFMCSSQYIAWMKLLQIKVLNHLQPLYLVAKLI